MAIRLGCRCGQQIITEEANMGQTVRCPACQLLLRVPMAQQPVPPAGPQYPGHGQPPTGIQGHGLPPGGYPQPPGQTSAGYPPQGMQPGYQAPLPHQQLHPGMPPQRVSNEAPIDPNDEPIIEDEEIDEEEEYREQKKKERKRIRRLQLKMTSWGLMAIYWGLVCWLTALAANGLMFVIVIITMLVNLSQGYVPTQQGGIQGGIAILLFLQFTSLTLVFIYSVLHLVGSILCCWVPPKSGGRPLIITSVSLVGAVFLLIVLLIAMSIGGAASGSGALTAMMSQLGIVLLIVMFLLMVASFVLFMLFLRTVANYLDQTSTGNEVISILTTWIGLFIALPLIILFSYLIIFAIIFVGGILSVVIQLIWFGYVVWQWVRLLNVVAAIRNELMNAHGV